MCKNCFSTCEPGKCSIGNSETSCSKCISSLFYDKSLKKCITSNICSNGLKGYL